MADENHRVLWSHRLDSDTGSFRFLCSACHDLDIAVPGPGLRYSEISETLLGDFLRESGGDVISCSACGEVLVKREGLEP